jgi:hypothetical protein
LENLLEKILCTIFLASVQCLASVMEFQFEYEQYSIFEVSLPDVLYMLFCSFL